ncbi:MAG: sulfatase-like hydrolase/transferase [Pseudomonadota bacterium]
MDQFFEGSPEAWIRFQRYYYNCILDVDRHIGTVLNALEQTGQAGNTVIVLVSDHGEMGGVHGLRQKGPWMFKENLSVPFVISQPDSRSSRQNRGLVSAIDFAPTMLGLVGMDKTEISRRYTAIRGQDISGDLASGSTNRSRTGGGALVTHSVSHTLDVDFAKKTLARRGAKIGDQDFNSADYEAGWVPDLSARGFIRGLITDDFKFARYFSPRDHHKPVDFDDLISRNDLELYDLEEDLGETRNLMSSGSVSRDLVLSLNDKLNILIEDEVGPDDGRDLSGPTFY